MTDKKRVAEGDDESASERALVAHQLNNALAVILGNAQIALLEANQPKVADHLREILEAGQRARDLIRRVLTLPPPPQHQSGMHQLSLEELHNAVSVRPTPVRILYVDDEEALVLLAQRQLERLGYEVVGATDAEEALHAFRKAPSTFAALMTDLNMPGMSGLALAKEALAIRPGVPVIVASGFVSAELRTEAAASGILHVVYKPSTMEELARVIHELLATDAK